MINKIDNFSQLPYSTYTGYLLKSEEDAKEFNEGFLIITKHPRMIILFVEFIEEISGKTVKKSSNMIE